MGGSRLPRPTWARHLERIMNDLDLPKLIRESLDQKQYQEEHWEGTFQQYLDLVQDNPLVVRTAHQRLYDMVLSHGVEEIEIDKEKVPRYRFFSDPLEDGRDGVFGLERSLQNLMAVFKAAAHGFGPERRVLLLHGDRAPAEEGPRGVLEGAAGRDVHVRVEPRRRARDVADERGAAAAAAA
jgi:hypothetical protein